MNKVLKKLLLGLTLVLGLSIIPFDIKASASQWQQNQTPDYPLLYVEGYEVTNESITPGMDFVLTVKVKNYSKTADANNVVVYMSNPEGVVPKYGTVNAVYIEQIVADSTEEVSFQYKANASLKITEMNFAVSVSCENSSSGVQLRIPVGRLTDVTVESYTIPEKMSAGAMGYASALVENVTDVALTNCRLVVKSNGMEIAGADIGTISAKMTKTQYVDLYFEKEGAYPVELLLYYKNMDGVEKQFTIANETINIFTEVAQDSSAVAPEEESYTEQPGNTAGLLDSGKIVVICVSGVLLIGLLCLILVLAYRRK